MLPSIRTFKVKVATVHDISLLGLVTTLYLRTRQAIPKVKEKMIALACCKLFSSA